MEVEQRRRVRARPDEHAVAEVLAARLPGHEVPADCEHRPEVAQDEDRERVPAADPERRGGEEREEQDEERDARHGLHRRPRAEEP